ncbi:MAG TPA: type II CAAX endopeptidase family protein [Myxococcaceae bacterium]
MEDSTLSNAPPPASTPTLGPLQLALISGTVGFGLFLTLGGASQLLNASFGLWFTEIFIFVGIAWVLLRSGGYEPWSYSGLSAPQLAPSVLGFAMGVANFFALVVPIQYVAQSLAPQWLRDMFDVSRVFESQSPLELGLMLAGVSLAAPFCEEFFFRGLLQKGLLSSRLSRTGAVLITSVVFSAFHLDPVGFVARVELGILFGVLRLYTGSLWPAIFAHAANNLVSSGIFLALRDTAAAASDAKPPLKVILLVMAAGGLALGLLVSLARAFPALWGPRQEPPTPVGPVPSPARLLLPWVLGATLSLVALVVVDMRGIRLNMVDLVQKLQKLPKDAPDGLHAERAHLKQLRREARSGRVPMEAYEEELARQAQSHPKKSR